MLTIHAKAFHIFSFMGKKRRTTLSTTPQETGNRLEACPCFHCERPLFCKQFYQQKVLQSIYKSNSFSPDARQFVVLGCRGDLDPRKPTVTMKKWMSKLGDDESFLEREWKLGERGEPAGWILVRNSNFQFSPLQTGGNIKDLTTVLPPFASHHHRL